MTADRIGRSTVYAHIGFDGAVLYIGRTSNIDARTADHHRSPWWPQVDRVDLLHDHITHEDACRLERLEIERHEPPNNYVFTRAWRELHAFDGQPVDTRPLTADEVARIRAAYAGRDLASAS